MHSANVIQEYINTGIVKLSPFDITNLQPTSVDVTLSKYIKTYVAHGPDIVEQIINLEETDGLILPQGVFVNGSTVERIELPNFISARFEGKSTLGRKGLLTHVSAGFIDPGFKGELTVEVVNLHPRPVRLYSGMKIGQICFFTVEGTPRGGYGDAMYGSHYQGQRGITPPYDGS